MIRSKNIHLFIIFLSILIVSPFFFESRLFMDDAVFHILRIEGLSQNIINHNFLSGVSQNFLGGFGYGVGLFYSNLFLYIPSLLILLGISSDTTYIIFLILINIITFYSSFYCLNNISKDFKINIYLSILYLIIPYRITNIYIRGAIGELLALIFIPLVMLGMYEILYRNKDKYHFLVLGMLGLLHSHILTLIITSILILIVTILNLNSINIKEKIYYLFKSAILSIILGCNFIFSMIEQFSTNTFYFSINKIYKDNVLLNILNIDNTYKILLNVLFILIFIYICLKKFKLSKITILFISISLAAIYSAIILTDIFPWDTFYPLLNLLQFPFRLHLVFTIILFICIIYFIKNIHEDDFQSTLLNKYIALTLFIFIFSFCFLLICFINVIKFYLNGSLYFYLYSIFLSFIFSLYICYAFYRKKISSKNEFILFFIKSIITLSFICIILLSQFCYTTDEKLNSNKLWLKNNEYYYSYSNSNYIIGKEYLPMNINLNKLYSNNIDNNIIFYDNYSTIKFKNYENNDWIEIPKIYYKGYKTYINNTEVKNKQSEDKFIKVKVKNIKEGTLKVIYEGTILSKFTLIINCIFILYFIISVYIVNLK